MEPIRYSAAACQVRQQNPSTRSEIRRNTQRMLQMIEMTVEGYRPFLPVKLLAFPEFAHAAPVYHTVNELLSKLAVPVPNEHTERYIEKARKYNIYIQTGTFLETDPNWENIVFNATCLIGPDSILFKYRKVNP